MISQKNIYFDTDCMSSFLWTNESNLLVQLYSGIMYLPKEVEKELSYPRLPPYFSSNIILPYSMSFLHSIVEIVLEQMKLMCENESV